MTPPVPTAAVERGSGGPDLVLRRTLPVPIDQTWTEVTDPSRTSRWIGPWAGNGRIGESLRLRLGAEEGAPWAEVRLIECLAPTRLQVLVVDPQDSWLLTVELVDRRARTDLRLVMHDVDPATIGEIGPGWEYYLDRLGAAVAGTPPPRFEEYFPGQKSYFEALLDTGRRH